MPGFYRLGRGARDLLVWRPARMEASGGRRAAILRRAQIWRAPASVPFRCLPPIAQIGVRQRLATGLWRAATAAPVRDNLGVQGRQAAGGRARGRARPGAAGRSPPIVAPPRAGFPGRGCPAGSPFSASFFINERRAVPARSSGGLSVRYRRHASGVALVRSRQSSHTAMRARSSVAPGPASAKRRAALSGSNFQRLLASGRGADGR
jgi:hypothetical protein